MSGSPSRPNTSGFNSNTIDSTPGAQSHPYKNLFERYDIDPQKGPRAITERLRELIEEAATEAERAELREAWDELTMHPMRRLRAAFGAHPESRRELGAPPPLPQNQSGQPDVGFNELAVRPSVAAALLGGADLLGPRRAAIPRAPSASISSDLQDNLDDDPILKRV